MNWIYKVRSKLKVAVVLLITVGAVVLGTFLERYCVRSINSSSSSMYNDRLIPAAEIYLLSDHIFSKYLLMQNMSEKSDGYSFKKVRKELSSHNQKIDSLIKDYELTYLVDSESEHLRIFKTKLKLYDQLEAKALYSSLEDPMQIDSRKMHSLFAGMREELKGLSQIQTTVGKELISGTKTMVARASLISNLQIVILIILCMLAQSLAFAHRDTQHRNDRYRWN